MTLTPMVSSLILIISLLQLSINAGKHPESVSQEPHYVAYYATLPLRESPYGDLKGIVRLTPEEACKRKHYRFEYDGEYKLREVSFRLGNTLAQPNHTANYFFTTPLQRITYTEEQEIRTFFDRFGNQVEQRGAFREIFTLDSMGRYRSLHFEDKRSQRIENKWGIYEYQWELQKNGSVIELRVDSQGNEVALRPGFEFYTIRLCYHQNGALALMQNLDEEENLRENSTGVAQDQLHFDKAGRWYGWTVLDANHKLKKGNGPNVAKGINGTDKYGYERSLRFEDEDGNPVINSHGFWGSKRYYDAFGNYDYTLFLDVNGEPSINEQSGYCMAKYTWSEDGMNRLRVDLLDVNGKAISHKTRGYASIQQTYNDDGNLMRTSYLDVNGELVNRIDSGRAYITYQYDDKKKLISSRKFNEKGEEIN